MIYVKKGNRRTPFSHGILARAIWSTGLSVEESYEIVEQIYEELSRSGREEIAPRNLKKMISKELLARGYETEERYHRLRELIECMESPMFILIGGGPGVGKSTISTALSQKFGINRVIGSDTIREIMRSMLSSDLIPPLHRSTFEASEAVKTSFVVNKLLYAFEQQVNLVTDGILAVVKRGCKEGLNMVLNGVHIVPGYLDERMKELTPNLFHYVLDVPFTEEHIQRFYAREEGTLRNPKRYIRRMDHIRAIQEYILSMAEKNGVKVIRNTDFDAAIREITEDVMLSLRLDECIDPAGIDREGA